MFKLSKASWIILSIGVLAIVLGSLGMAYAEQKTENSRLEEELDQAALKLQSFNLSELQDERSKLEADLKEAQANYESAKKALSPQVESIDITTNLYQDAQECQVEIVAISSAPLSESELNGITFHTLPIEVEVEGEIAGIINFLNKIDSQFGTGAITSVKVNVKERDEVEKMWASIKLEIYTYGE